MNSKRLWWGPNLLALVLRLSVAPEIIVADAPVVREVVVLSTSLPGIDVHVYYESVSTLLSPPACC